MARLYNDNTWTRPTGVRRPSMEYFIHDYYTRGDDNAYKYFKTTAFACQRTMGVFDMCQVRVAADCVKAPPCRANSVKAKRFQVYVIIKSAFFYFDSTFWSHCHMHFMIKNWNIIIFDCEWKKFAVDYATQMHWNRTSESQ